MRECMCELIYVLHSHYEQNRQKRKKKQQHTIWFVIMYESLLVLFEFG